MATSPGYTQYILDQMRMAGEVTHRKMFGGVGIYVDEVFCAIIGSSDRFYLRIGPENLADFTAQGMSKFPGGKGKGMPYYEVPEQVVEDPEILAQWAQKARAQSVAAKKK